MTKTFGYASVLQVTTTTGDAAIGQITNITGPGVDFADVDTTTMDSSSNYRTFVPGLGDPGEITISLVYAPTTVSHKRLMYYMGQRSVKAFKLYQGGSTAAGDEDTFSAYIKSMGREIPMDGLITGDVTLKVTGKPGYTT
jgi:hypothetical protein